jgi:hypothetical protein
MPNGFLVLDEKDWESMTEQQKDWTIYKTLRAVNERITCLERRPFIDRFTSFFGGIIGGFIAAIGLKFLAK